MTFREQRTLEQVKLQLTEWRVSNSAPTPIPGEIWDAAVHLAAKHGAGQIARALRLDYGALKKRMRPVASRQKTAQDAPPTFVELLAPPAPAVIRRCVIEAHSTNPRQCPLRVKLTDVTPAALASIIRQVLA